MEIINKYKLEINSYQGGKHCYGSLVNMETYDKVSICRPITQKEIDSDYDRFYFLTDGKMVEYHNSVKELIACTVEYCIENKIELENVIVEGLRNYKEQTLKQLSIIEKFDFRIYCHFCKKLITGGMYNAFGGTCMDCYEKRFK